MTKILELKLMTLQTGELAAVNRAFHNAIFHWNFKIYSVKILLAIIDWLCLGIPKWCIVGYLFTCSNRVHQTNLKHLQYWILEIFPCDVSGTNTYSCVIVFSQAKFAEQTSRRIQQVRICRFLSHVVLQSLGYFIINVYSVHQLPDAFMYDEWVLTN